MPELQALLLVRRSNFRDTAGEALRFGQQFQLVFFQSAHPVPVKEISRLVEVDTTDTRTHVTWANAAKSGVSYPNCRDYARLNHVFDGLTCYMFVPLTWSGGAESKQVDGQLVSANYFDVLGRRPALGGFFFPNEDQKPSGNNVAVVSYSFWANHLGGDASVIGRVLQLNATPFTVIGVAPRGFKDRSPWPVPTRFGYLPACTRKC